MVLKNMNDLNRLVEGGARKRLVLAAAQDHHSLGAVIRARIENIIEPIFVGNKRDIEKICESYNYDIEGITIIDEPDQDACIETAVKMISSKQGDILMKGKIGSASLLRSVLNKDWGLRTGNLLSHFALFEVETYPKVIAVTDVAMNIAPSLQDKIAIVNNSVSCLNNSMLR